MFFSEFLGVENKHHFISISIFFQGIKLKYFCRAHLIFLMALLPAFIHSPHALHPRLCVVFPSAGLLYSSHFYWPCFLARNACFLCVRSLYGHLVPKAFPDPPHCYGKSASPSCFHPTIPCIYLYSRPYGTYCSCLFPYHSSLVDCKLPEARPFLSHL